MPGHMVGSFARSCSAHYRERELLPPSNRACFALPVGARGLAHCHPVRRPACLAPCAGPVAWAWDARQCRDGVGRSSFVWTSSCMAPLVSAKPLCDVTLASPVGRNRRPQPRAAAWGGAALRKARCPGHRAAWQRRSRGSLAWPTKEGRQQAGSTPPRPPQGERRLGKGAEDVANTFYLSSCSQQLLGRACHVGQPGHARQGLRRLLEGDPRLG